MSEASTGSRDEIALPITVTRFNASEYLLDRRVREGDGSRVALIHRDEQVTYQDLLDRVLVMARGLEQLGLQPEQRLVMVVADSPDFVVLFLAAMRIGAVPVPISTMSTAKDVHGILSDARATLVAVSGAFAGVIDARVAGVPSLRAVIDVDGVGITVPSGPDVTTAEAVADLGRWAGPTQDVCPTTADSPAFWLYTSGTTGQPKAAMHRHGSVQVVVDTYATQVLGITRDDRCLSAAKAFFAFGIGNSVLFPLAVGASVVLLPEPSRPELVADLVARHRPTLFFAGPTFFSNMLRADLPAGALASVRLIASAGEALPASLYQRFVSRFGVDILDGIGMTEMLHIFLSNRSGAVRPGTTGEPVPGYDLELRDEAGAVIDGPDRPGSLFVRGASTATGYWSRYDATRTVFQGEWLRTGDTYVRDADGYYSCLGRSGDMLKAGGMWVSPTEIERQLLAHAAVAQAVVVAATDLDGLEKAVAYVVLHPGRHATEEELTAYCRAELAAFKRPRRVIVVGDLPLTATGKVRRADLRAMATGSLAADVVALASTPPTA